MVYILLAPGFEEAEALVPADLLRRADVPVCLTGVGGACITGAHGVRVMADEMLEYISPEPGDTLVLPGGPGVAALEGSGAVHALVRRAAEEEGMYLAAICAAPTLLARMGLLQGRRAVCYPGMEGDLSANGAIPCMDQSTVGDGKFLTGRAPGSAFDFGLALVELLSGPQTAARVRRDAHYHG